jgi:hypothetical protein
MQQENQKSMIQTTGIIIQHSRQPLMSIRVLVYEREKLRNIYKRIKKCYNLIARHYHGYAVTPATT